jgi:uncharacterized membrane protein
LLDTLRGAALIAMATYHFTWDLEFVGYLTPGTAETGLLKLYARAIASTFLFIVGISLVLANTPETRWTSFWKRFGMIAAASVVISAATFFLHAGRMDLLRHPALHRHPEHHRCAGASASSTGDHRDHGSCRRRLARRHLGFAWCAALASCSIRAIWPGSALPRCRSGRTTMCRCFRGWCRSCSGLTSASVALKTNLPARLAALGTGSSLLAKAGRHSLAFYLIHQPVLIAIAFGLAYIVPPAKPDPVPTYLQQCNVSCSLQEGEALCRSFCQCTLEKLQTQKLFTPFQSGEIKSDDESHPRARASVDQQTVAPQGRIQVPTPISARRPRQASSILSSSVKVSSISLRFWRRSSRFSSMRFISSLSWPSSPGGSL